MTRLRALVSSWLFPPYSGSAEFDILKRLEYCHIDFDVVQARRTNPDSSLLDLPANATFQRTEVDLGNHPPRSRKARAAFAQGVLAIHAANDGHYQFLLSHSNEVPSHEAALRIKAKRPDLPWVAYFGDVVSKNPYVRHLRDFPLFEEDCLTESRTLARADLIVCNNEYQRQLMLAAAQPNAEQRVVVIPHAFDSRRYPGNTAQKNERFTFVHSGTLYSTKRNATPILQAIDLLIDVYPSLTGLFEFVFVGDDVPSQDLACWERMRHRNHVRFVPGVGYHQSLALMKAADALVVIDGLFTPDDDGLEASPYFPGKLADYFGTGRPILGITMSKGPTADLLKSRGEFIASDSPESIAYGLKRYIEGHVAHNVPPSRFRAECVGAQMELAFRSAVEGPEAMATLHRRLRDVP